MMSIIALVISIISVIGCGIILFLTCVEDMEWGKYEWADKVSTMVSKMFARIDNLY